MQAIALGPNHVAVIAGGHLGASDPQAAPTHAQLGGSPILSPPDSRTSSLASSVGAGTTPERSTLPNLEQICRSDHEAGLQQALEEQRETLLAEHRTKTEEASAEHGQEVSSFSSCGRASYCIILSGGSSACADRRGHAAGGESSAPCRHHCSTGCSCSARGVGTPWCQGRRHRGSSG